MTEPRQRPGAVCQECRRRKLKCNGSVPQCSVCAASGVECIVIGERMARGPKKGHVKALRSRVATLESQLRQSQLSAQTSSDNSNNSSTSNITPDETTPASFKINTDNTYLASPQSGSMGTFILNGSQETLDINPDLINLPDAINTTFLSIPACQSLPSSINSASILCPSSMSPPISGIMEAELNQLFFDRVYPFVPILQQHRYLRKFKQTEARTDSQVCLQYCMWMLASLMSAHFQHLQDSFYLGAKRILENSNLLPNIVDDQTQTELVQSWVLVAVFESMKANHRQAWLSAGQAFRLVQLMRLHELDMPSFNSSCLSQSQFVEKEEQRRIFWLAYLLDHLFSMRNSWPTTLSEHIIKTRLPAPEEDFQSGKRSTGCFLPDAIGEAHPTKRSTFDECLVLAALCERSLLYCQQNDTTRLCGQTTLDWADQHQQLEMILDSRLQMMSENYPPPTQVYDPMLLFAHIMSQATTLYISANMLGAAAWPLGSSQNDTMTKAQQRALAAADKIIDLAKSLTDFHVFKTHPLTPIPLFVSIEFLYTNRSTNEGFGAKLQELRSIFRELKTINNTSQSYIDLLGLSCTPTAIEMLAS